MESSPNTLDLRRQEPADQTGGEEDSECWPLSGKPYFYVILTDKHLAKAFRLNIPSHLSEQLPVATVPATIECRGKTWDMLYKGNRLAANCGFERQAWAKFATDNNLEAGDACVFELMEGSSECTRIKFKVQILRGDFPTELIEKAERTDSNYPDD